MATEPEPEPVPAKHHQPLHNFSLPFLKWGQRLQINHHCRRNRNRNNNNNRNASGNGNSSDSDNNRSTKPHRSCTDHARMKIDEKNGGVSLEKRNSKLPDADLVTAGGGDVKPWNLRPRRCSITGDGSGAAGTSVKSRRTVRRVGDGDGAPEEKEEDRKKRRLWISLSKEEIEEDIYAFTGSKPSGRPKKRNRTVQKLLDNVFPGLYMAGISADSYRV